MSESEALSNAKLSVLVVGQTPPPYHGQAMMIRHLLDIRSPDLELTHVRMAFSGSMGEVGRFKLTKLTHLFQVIVQVWIARFRYRAKVFYFPPASPSRIPIYRDLAILLCCRWLFDRTVFHFHAAGLSEMLPRLNVIERWLAYRAYGNPEDTICMSQLTRDDAVAIDSQRTWIVPYGIPDESPVEQGTNEVHTDAQLLKILYVGTVNRTKGILDVIDACRILREQDIEFQLKIVGSFQPLDFEGELKRRIDEKGLSDCVDLCGQLIGPEKHTAFAECDVFCFPSYYEAEGFPCVLLEAMSHGKAIVSTQWRGIPAMVDSEFGILVPIQSPPSIAEALESLARDRSRLREMGQASRRKYEANYTLSKFQDTLTKLLVDPKGSYDSHARHREQTTSTLELTSQNG